MSGVARYVKMTAEPGRGDALAAAMLRVADSLTDTPGCDLYLVNRSADAPDEVWVTELWRSQDAVDTSLRELQTEAGRVQLAEVMGLLAGPPQRTNLTPLGGVGAPR
jgi:quinol monooxygenase YgiN